MIQSQGLEISSSMNRLLIPVSMESSIVLQDDIPYHTPDNDNALSRINCNHNANTSAAWIAKLANLERIHFARSTAPQEKPQQRLARLTTKHPYGPMKVSLKLP